MKYLELKNDEGICIYNPKSSKALKINFKENNFEIKSINDVKNEENIIVKTVSEDELKSFYLFDVYIQNCIVNEKEIENMHNKLLDFHYNFLYNNLPKNKSIKNYDFQVIINLEDNFI